MLIQFTFFSAYFLMAIPSSRILARIGYQMSIVLGLGVMGLGALLFFPAASLASYPLFLRRCGCWRPASRCCRWRPTRTWRNWGRRRKDPAG